MTVWLSLVDIFFPSSNGIWWGPLTDHIQGDGSTTNLCGWCRLPQVFHPSDDELTQRLSTVELVVDGEKLHDLKMTVSESILDSAKVHAQGKNIKTGVVEAHRLTQHDPSPYASLTFFTPKFKLLLLYWNILDMCGYVWSCFAIRSHDTHRQWPVLCGKAWPRSHQKQISNNLRAGYYRYYNPYPLLINAPPLPPNKKKQNLGTQSFY